METRILVSGRDLMSATVTHTAPPLSTSPSMTPDGDHAPPLILETDEERRLFEEGAQRQELRLERRREERTLRP
jgi:hypothetical protein